MDGLVLEIFEGVFGVEYLSIEELEGIAIGFDADIAKSIAGSEEAIYTADAIEDFDPIFGEGSDSPTGELGENPQSFDPAGTVGVFNVELVVAGELFGESVTTPIEWPDQARAEILRGYVEVLGEEVDDFFAMAGFVAVFAGFEDGLDDRHMSIWVLLYPGFGESQHFFGVARPNI
jgi:hypothetical protein